MIRLILLLALLTGCATPVASQKPTPTSSPTASPTTVASAMPKAACVAALKAGKEMSDLAAEFVTDIDGGNAPLIEIDAETIDARASVNIQALPPEYEQDPTLTHFADALVTIRRARSAAVEGDLGPLIKALTTLTTATTDVLAACR